MKLFVTASLIFILSLGVASQRKGQPQKTLIDASKASVYLTFLRKVQSRAEKTNGVDRYLLFKITNNTRWPIILQMSGPYIDDVDVGLYYLVENLKTGERRAGNLSCHVCSLNPLASGKSVSFAVPLNHACNDAKMTVDFRFEWEDELISTEVSETRHSSIFYFRSIPESVLPLLKEADKKFTYQQHLCYVE